MQNPNLTQTLSPSLKTTNSIQHVCRSQQEVNILEFVKLLNGPDHLWVQCHLEFELNVRRSDAVEEVLNGEWKHSS